MDKYDEIYYYSDFHTYTDMDRLLKQASCTHKEWAEHEDGEIYCKACKACASDIDNSLVEKKVKENR